MEDSGILEGSGLLEDSGILSEDLPVPLVKLGGANQSFTLSWMNLAAQEWLSISSSRAIGRALTDIVIDNGGLKAALAKVGPNLSRFTLSDHEVRLPKRDSERFNICVFMSGGTQAVLFNPVSSRGRRADMIEAEATTGLGRMLAHEIKNPLAGIHGAAQLLHNDITTQEGRELINLISVETERIRRLAERMERLGDDVETEFHPVNIHEILRHSRLLFQSGGPKNLAFEEHYDPSLPEASGHPDMLMQVIVNLIKNASEAIEKTQINGLIKLETSYRSGVHRRLNGMGDDAALPIEIRIADNGPGISDDVRDHMFQPFVTSKPSGQGLGLALVSKFITAHRGLIEVQSVPGNTVFTIRLPRPHKNETSI